MKTITQFLVSLIIAFCIILISLLSAQNGQPVYLQLFGAKSIQIPVGLLLTFSFVTGFISMSILPTVWNAIGSVSSNSSRYQKDDDFFVEEEY